MSTAHLHALAMIFRSPSKANSLVVYLSSAALMTVLTAVMFLMYRSSYSPKPIQLTDVVVLVNNESLTGNIQLIDSRKYIGKSEETVGVIRVLRAEHDHSRRVVLESGLLSATIGPFGSTSVITLPASIQGRWCLDTSYTWRPSWSQAEFVMESPEICFETSPNA